MKMLSVAVDDLCAMSIDKVVAVSGLYSSRSEFLKDSIRKNLAAVVELNYDLKKVREETKKLAGLAKQRGYKGGIPSKEEREKVAIEYLKEKKLM